MVRRNLRSWLALGVLAALAAGCAEQQDPINQVEARVYSKSLFTGEWYFGQTVVDVPGTNTITMVGNTNYNGMYRIRWDVQEDYLYARKTYEQVQGAKHINPYTGEYKGTIVGAWPIESHFDIKRSYNPTTGEENNVLTENSADCKWYNCKHMRVDWSKNHAVDYMFLDDGTENTKAQPLSYEEWDTSDPLYAPVFDEKNGYIDFTTAMVVNPQMYSFSWGGQIYNFPLCWFFSGENAECSPEVVKVRYSFMRREANRDYEPRLHQGVKDEWFGYFVQERLNWDQHYDLTYKKKQKLINRHNIWEQHHDANQPCASDADCTAPGSKCDLLMVFNRQDVDTDSDADGLPDSFEEHFGLDPKSFDSNNNGISDARDDHNKDGIRDAENYWAWNEENQEHRCTIPVPDRHPRPIAYYDTGFMPKSMLCDEHNKDPKLDDDPNPCQQWQFVPPAQQEQAWSTVHKISNDYDNTYWKVFLMASYGWTYDKYKRWIDTRDPNQFDGADREILDRFGDAQNGYYAFTICPNNPVQAYDPWPCRFPHMSFREAKELMAEGRTFGLVDAEGNEIAPAPRRGDVRFSLINYVRDYYDGMALLGLGPSMTDPVTGENLAGVANIYGLNDWAATNTQEMVQLLNGDIQPDQFINGVTLETWLKKTQATQQADFAQQQAVSQAQVEEMYDATMQQWMKKIPRKGGPEAMANLMVDSRGNPYTSKQIKLKMFETAFNSGLFDPARGGPGLDLIKGTPIEKKLIDEEVLLYSGINPDSVTDLTPEIMEQASIARSGFLKKLDAMEALRYELANRHNMDFMSMADDAMIGLATRLKGQDPQTVWNTARNIIYRAVLTHEMGHTVGLHHNWSGSEDVINFFDDYWKLRTNNGQNTDICAVTPQGQASGLCPFYLQPMTDYQLGRDQQNLAEGTRGLYEYSYSSIMDYAGRYTIDGNGLGKYDIAAIIYGHADKVEVYKDTALAPLNAAQGNIFEEYFTSYGSPLWFPRPNFTPTSYHYTNFYAQMGDKLIDENNRQFVPYTDVVEFCQELDSSYDATGVPLPCDDPSLEGKRTAELGYLWKDGDPNRPNPRVPYLFCTYTRGDISDGCNTRDYGADQYERMKQLIDGWDTWYLMRSFPRSQYAVSDWSYRGRQYRRLYYRLKNFNDGYAMLQGSMMEWFDADTMRKFYTSPVWGYGPYTVAMNDAFNMALRTMAMPDVKAYEFNPQPDGQQIYNEAEYFVDFYSDLSNGRYFATSYYDADWRNECGLKWWECLHHVGFYIDKIMALMALTAPEANFVGRDTAEDIRKYRISFFNNYTDQIVDFLGGILAEDHEAIGPWYDESKPKNDVVVDNNGVVWANGMAQRNYATPSLDPGKPAQGGAVEAATRFTLQVYAAVIGMVRLHENFDTDFADRARMWKVGSGTSWEITPTAKVSGVTQYTDPITGTTYRGIDYVDNRGVAERMIARANRLKARSNYCNSAGGQPDSCTPVSAAIKAKADTEIELYRQLMDIVVQLTVMYHDWAGANWSWNPYDP